MTLTDTSPRTKFAAFFPAARRCSSSLQTRHTLAPALDYSYSATATCSLTSSRLDARATGRHARGGRKARSPLLKLLKSYSLSRHSLCYILTTLQSWQREGLSRESHSPLVVVLAIADRSPTLSVVEIPAKKRRASLASSSKGLSHEAAAGFESASSPL